MILGLVDFVLLTFFWWSIRFLLARNESWTGFCPSAVATAVFWIGTRRLRVGLSVLDFGFGQQIVRRDRCRVHPGHVVHRHGSGDRAWCRRWAPYGKHGGPRCRAIVTELLEGEIGLVPDSFFAVSGFGQSGVAGHTPPGDAKLGLHDRRNRSCLRALRSPHGAPLLRMEVGAERQVFTAPSSPRPLLPLHNQLTSAQLAVTIVVTLIVYWLAEQYAELLGAHTHDGRLPSVRSSSEISLAGA